MRPRCGCPLWLPVLNLGMGRFKVSLRSRPRYRRVQDDVCGKQTEDLSGSEATVEISQKETAGRAEESVMNNQSKCSQVTPEKARE
jgi:hypothetical protein